jgi:hypothetical protein
MKQSYILTFLFLAFLVSCSDPVTDKPKTDESIGDKLPVKNRDFYFEPLESVFDDLKEMVDIDESYFNETDTWREGDVSGTIFYKLNGNDTALAKLEISDRGKLKEVHAWYYDNKGNLFFSEHEITNLEYGFEKGPSQRNYKFYFDDNGSQLSSYARMSFDGNPLPEEWTTVTMTEEESAYLKSRLTAARKAQRAVQQAD